MIDRNIADLAWFYGWTTGEILDGLTHDQAALLLERAFSMEARRNIELMAATRGDQKNAADYFKSMIEPREPKAVVKKDFSDGLAEIATAMGNGDMARKIRLRKRSLELLKATEETDARGSGSRQAPGGDRGPKGPA